MNEYYECSVCKTYYREGSIENIKWINSVGAYGCPTLGYSAECKNCHNKRLKSEKSKQKNNNFSDVMSDTAIIAATAGVNSL